MMQKFKQVAVVVALGSFEIGAIALLHRLGQIEWMSVPWSSLQSWSEIAPIEDVVAAGLRATALAIAYWIAGSTVVYGAARISRAPRLVRVTTRVTLPPIRRALDRAIAVGVTAATLAAPIAPAAATEVPSPQEPVVYQMSDQGVPTPINAPAVDATAIFPPGVGGAGYTPRPAGGLTLEEGADAVVPAGASNAAGDGTASTPYDVVAGDNLWTISAVHLRAIYANREVDTGEIAKYWRRVIEANAAGLRSGNPNLIYPGERILLPDPGPAEDS